MKVKAAVVAALVILTAGVRGQSHGITPSEYHARRAAVAKAIGPNGVFIAISPSAARRTGDVDWRVVGSSYLAIFAVGAGYLSIGLMTSALSYHQLPAAALAAMAIVVLFMLGIGEFVFPEGPLHDFCSYVSVWGQMSEMSRGIVDLRRLVFDASIVIVGALGSAASMRSLRSVSRLA